jgi:hypothetical protein
MSLECNLSDRTLAVRTECSWSTSTASQANVAESPLKDFKVDRVLYTGALVEGGGVTRMWHYLTDIEGVSSPVILGGILRAIVRQEECLYGRHQMYQLSD